VIGTVPLPFCAEVVVTPELFVTVKVPAPKLKIVYVPSFPPSCIPAITTVSPIASAGPEFTT
jgi:hypothetical protein